MALLPAPLNRRVRHVLEENSGSRTQSPRCATPTCLRWHDYSTPLTQACATSTRYRCRNWKTPSQLLRLPAPPGHAFRWRLRRLGPRLVPAPGPDPPERHPGHSERPRTADPHDGRARHRRERVSERAGSARGVDPRPVNHAGKAQDRDLEARPVVHCGSALQQKRYSSWELREASPLRES